MSQRIQCHENTPVQRRQFPPAGIPGSFQARLLRLIYCETTIATWCLTFWRCLFSICCVFENASAAKRSRSLSVGVLSRSVAGNKRLKNTGVVPEKGQQWSLFSFCLAFVLSAPSFCLRFFFFFCLRFDVKWLVVGGRWLGHLEPASGRVCYPAGFPVIWGHATLVRVTHPGGACSARQVTRGQKHIV